MENLLLEQYARFKKPELEESPYRCLLDASIEINPHQINAFCAAITALKTGGIILADEVGLGKTIEAGLVLKHVIDSGAKRILIALPASLRKQWEIELSEKFGISSIILDRYTVRNDENAVSLLLHSKNAQVVLTSYDFSSKLMNMKRFKNIQWDLIVIDEAHNLRNVFNGTKRAKRLYDASKGIPKVLLTATPLQNSLEDLHGLVAFIDPHVFGNKKIFVKRYVNDEDYDGLKRELLPVLYRTLRQDVTKYMEFKKRECHTVDFELTDNEKILYARVNNFLKRDNLYSIPTANKRLILLVIRKLLASSSFALVDTFEVLKERLEKLYEGTKSADAQEGFDFFWSFVEDEIDEDDFEDVDDEDTAFKKQQIQEEINEVEAIIETAENIKKNAKIEALKIAIDTAFAFQEERGIEQKVVIFTESKRTQKYIAADLVEYGIDEENIVLFNGDMSDPLSKQVYKAWQAKNFGKTNYGKSIEFKHAIVDYFKNNAKILIATDAGSEGLNLQFSNTIINYDLPWNPQKIEQRIGRVHRYGQQHDVVAINLLNTGNEADKRVYDILSRKFELFEGVFGASDIALGALENGASFEKTILDIYQNCDSASDFKREFDKLDRKLVAKRDVKAKKLQSLLLTESTDAQEESLAKTKANIEKYLQDVQYWENIEDGELGGGTSFLSLYDWGEEIFACHGTLFIGAFCNGTKMLFPVLLLCDDNGEYYDFTEDDIVNALEKVDDGDLHYFTPTAEENELYAKMYDRLILEMTERYNKYSQPIMDYNKHKVENWVEIQKDLLSIQISEVANDVATLNNEASQAKEFLRKVDIKKEAEKKQKALEQLQRTFHQKVSKIQLDGEESVAEFNKQFDIKPMLMVNVVLKF